MINIVTIRTYGFITAYLPSTLAEYLRKFVEHVRPWYFPNKAEAQTTGTYLFLNKDGEKLKSVGPRFQNIMKNYFNSNASVTCIRKSMETAVSSCSHLQSDVKRNLSFAMLHDPATAQKFYVMKDSLQVSQEVNQQWQQFRQALAPAPIHIEFAAPSPLHSGTTTVETNQVAQLIPTSTLHCPSPMLAPPPLVSTTSSANSSPIHEEYSRRELAESIASQLVSVVSVKKPKKVPNEATSFQRRPGDWFCDECGYDNFAYRPTCKHCGGRKLKRKASASLDSTPTKRVKHDIVAILETGKNKENEKIYKVKSLSKGEMWVREKHVPVELL